MSLRPVVAVTASITAIAISLSASPARAGGGCRSLPDASALQGSADEVFARGHLAFKDEHFAAAAALFREVAIAHPDVDAGRSAVTLALESLNRAAAKEGNGCYDVMAEDVPKYLEVYCAATGKPEPDDPCEFLHRIAAGIARLRAETLMHEADKLPRIRAIPIFREAGDRYLAIWNDHFKAACRSGKATCQRADEVLYNAARAYQVAGAIPEASAARAVLRDPANKLTGTALARKALLEDGYAWQAIGEYERAASAFERYVAESPKEKAAPDSIQDAMLLRFALGDQARAEQDFETMVKDYGAADPKRIARAAAAMALHFEERSAFAEVERFVAKRGALLANAPPVLAIRVDAALAHALAMQGKKAKADEIYKRVATVPPRGLVPPEGDDFTAMREFARALTAIGEAKLYLADQARDAAMRLKVKKGDNASLEAKRRAVAEAEKAYAQIDEIQPFPPPRAIVAAAGRVARMRSQLWAQVYLAMGPAAAEAEERIAMAAHARCVGLGIKLQVGNDESRASAAWLERHQPQRFPPLREILPAPRFLGNGSESTGRPLGDDGEPR